MEEKIKESYSRIRMPENSKERISREIQQSSAAGEKGAKAGHSGVRWKAGLAACLSLALIIPSGVFAAKKLSQYFTVKIGGEKYQAEISLDKTDAAKPASAQDKKSADKKMKYIQVKSQFGKEYVPAGDETFYEQKDDGRVISHEEQPEEGTDGVYSYCHKDGFQAGKDFYYEVIYVDQKENAILKLYDQTHKEEITINGHRALVSQSGGVQGSRYRSERDTDYTIQIYVFYEEYGYIIEYCGMQGLGREKLAALAEKTKVSECREEKASRYTDLSLYQKGAAVPMPKPQKEQIAAPVKTIGQKLENEAFVYQVTDMKISSRVTDLDKSKLNDTQVPTSSILWNEKGDLKSYIRESIAWGDGVSTPECFVTGRQRIQPKMVYITMKVKAKKENELFCLPDIKFFEKEGRDYYDSELYHQYSRPVRIKDSLMDFMPCYFMETEQGDSFHLKRMKAGEERIYHFAYMVDGDMTDKMFLCLDYMMKQQYVDLNQK